MYEGLVKSSFIFNTVAIQFLKKILSKLLNNSNEVILYPENGNDLSL